MTALPKRKYSLQEYFEIERNSEEKFEYWDGNIWSVAGASPAHERIVVNIGAHLQELLRGRGCSVLGSNLKVKVPVYPPYRYPDLSIYCSEGIFETMDGLDVLMNPQMLVEVLSLGHRISARRKTFIYRQTAIRLKNQVIKDKIRRIDNRLNPSSIRRNAD